MYIRKVISFGGKEDGEEEAEKKEKFIIIFQTVGCNPLVDLEFTSVVGACGLVKIQYTMPW